MLKLRDKMAVPPGYWRFPRRWIIENDRYISPVDDGDFIFGGDYPQLVDRVVEYRIINTLPLGDADSEVQDWICRNTGASCAPERPKSTEPRRRARGRDVATFLQAMAEWVKSDEIVPQEEAERRAEICGGCRFNVEIDDGACMGCFGLTARIMRIIGQRKTRVDSVLKFCAECGCSGAVMAFVPMTILNKAHVGESFTDNTGQQVDGVPVPCWRREQQ